jgi:CSLREA domain-containing protein
LQLDSVSGLVFPVRESKQNEGQNMKMRALSLVLGLAVAVLIPVTMQADTITVNSLDDDGNGLDGDCNLREAVLAANGNIGLDGCDEGNGADEIVFAAGLTGTISLASALPSVTDSLAITGPGADVLTIDGGQHESIFQFNSPTNDQTYSVSGLTLTNGRGSDGGGGDLRPSGRDGHGLSMRGYEELRRRQGPRRRHRLRERFADDRGFHGLGQ